MKPTKSRANVREMSKMGLHKIVVSKPSVDLFRVRTGGASSPDGRFPARRGIPSPAGYQTRLPSWSNRPRSVGVGQYPAAWTKASSPNRWTRWSGCVDLPSAWTEHRLRPLLARISVWIKPLPKTLSPTAMSSAFDSRKKKNCWKYTALGRASSSGRLLRINGGTNHGRNAVTRNLSVVAKMLAQQAALPPPNSSATASAWSKQSVRRYRRTLRPAEPFGHLSGTGKNRPWSARRVSGGIVCQKSIRNQRLASRYDTQAWFPTRRQLRRVRGHRRPSETAWCTSPPCPASSSKTARSGESWRRGEVKVRWCCTQTHRADPMRGWRTGRRKGINAVWLPRSRRRTKPQTNATTAPASSAMADAFAEAEAVK